MKTKAFRLLGFILIGTVLFCVFFRVFRFKNAKSLEQYYTLPRNSVDVLFIGSSHAYRNIDPAVLYEEQGISAYVLGSPSQPIWNTYYYLNEALGTQSPRVVFIECYEVRNQEYSDDATALKATMGLRLSRNYLEAVYASIQDKSMFADFALQFPWFHARYEELDWKRDVLPYYGDPYYRDYLGFVYYTEPKKALLPENLARITRRKALSGKCKDYLDRIIRLSEEKGFELVFLITPFDKDADEKQPFFNSLADFLAERNQTLINCNFLYGELSLDPDADFAHGSHLSLWGADKVTSYLGRYLKAHHDGLADHRNDERYARWERNLADIRDARENRNLIDAEDSI